MKNLWFLSALLCVLMAGIVRADAPKKEAQEAMMKAWMAAATPGAPHQHLAAMVGTWDAVVKTWEDPSAPPSESKGTSVMSMVLGGRYLVQQFRGEMMGQPYEGTGYTGYDNVQKKYIGTWMDNMSTGMMVMTGTQDPATGKVNYVGKMWDAMTGKESSTREVMTKVAPDHFVFEMFAPGMDGKEMKMMEIQYTKKS
jgi:hypothetical protein